MQDLDGWYLDLNDASTKANETTTLVISDVTYHAKWVTTTKVAMVGTTKYTTLQDAVNAVPINGVQTTVLLLNNTDEKVSVNGGRNVYLNLRGNTVKNTNATLMQVFEISNATLELANGTVTSGIASGMINVNSGGVLKVNDDATLNMTGTRQAIYVDSGTVYVLGGTITNKKDRAAIHVINNGTAIITGGTITSTNAYALYNESGTMTIGEKDGTIDTTKPIIQGKTYGIVAKSSYKFYDGIIMGETAPAGITANGGRTPTITTDTGETKMSEYETGAEKVYNTSGSYNQLYLQHQSSKYQVTLHANGGSVTPTVISVDNGDPIGAIPDPTNGAYTFTGWLDENDQPVDENTIPTGDMDIYAQWSFTPAHATLNIINDPMTEYFSSISSWKNNESTFLTSMESNFNTYNCLSCDANSNYQSCPSTGEVQCDRPKGFATGVTGAISVYTSDETTKAKGTKVTYVTVSSNGTIYDMIPGNTYYWELDSDPNVYGTVTVSGQRRIVEAGGVRNIRDLGGLQVDTNNDGTPDGTIDYGRMFRGPKLNSSADVTSLETLGITKEIDLRGSQNDPKLSSNYVGREIRNYEISPSFNNGSYYNQFRQALSDTIDDIIAGENIYFHCAIGTDRTGTMAWFLEGLLGVSEEDRIEDYELSYFYGLLNRHRFYRLQPGSSITHRFEYMHQTYPTNTDIYNYYTNNGTEHVQQVEDFRNAVITSN